MMAPFRWRLALVALVALVAVGCDTRPQPPRPQPSSKEDIAPEAATGYRPRAPVSGNRLMVGSANPHASRAGLEVLQEGGSAVDAAIAMALVLTLVEPQSSGIGGGAFLLHFDAARGEVRAYDGRETAPRAASPDMFLVRGRPMGFLQAVVGGLSVGAPGELRVLELVHQKHGRLPWKRLFEPAIALAEDGFEISPRLYELLLLAPSLAKMKVAGGYFYRDGKPRAAGERLKNPELAAVLRAVAEEGTTAFYEGPIAADIVVAVEKAEKNPGRLRASDLAEYRALERDPVCMSYRRHRICGMPPPSSGGITTLQIMGLLERFPLSERAAGSLEVVHLFAEAGRLAYADRDRYLADPDFVDLPMGRLLDRDYLARRSQLIDEEKSMGVAQPGVLPGGPVGLLGDDDSPELPSTSHLVAVDAEGNAVSMTASIENAFGSGVMVRGFLLNNELTDFSFAPTEGGRPVANRVEPGKRPRSSMAPIIVTDEKGRFLLALGSPGGSRIIPYVARVLVAVLDHGLGLQEAIGQPNFANRNGPTELEPVEGHERWLSELEKGLTARGHEVRVVALNSGLHGILRSDGGYQGGADPRREGLILSD